jgi:hypothetical protein
VVASRLAPLVLLAAAAVVVVVVLAVAAAGLKLLSPKIMALEAILVQVLVPLALVWVLLAP